LDDVCHAGGCRQSDQQTPTATFAELQAFRAKANLLMGNNNTTLSNQQLGDLNTQLTAARAQKTHQLTRLYQRHR
jgi:uncharacterized protein involved in exopolysaccharide biosynthesis